MADVWITVAALAAITALLRASGPVLVGGRELPARAMAVIALLAPALLAALVVVETLGSEDGSLHVDARLAGVAAAGVALAAGRSLLLAVAAGAVTAALLRALF